MWVLLISAVFIQMVKGWLILHILVWLLSKLKPRKFAKWMIRAIIHPAAIGVFTFAIAVIISQLVGGDSSYSGVGNILGSILLSVVFPFYAKRRYKDVLA